MARVLQVRCDLHLPREARQEGRIVGELGRQHLDRHVSPDLELEAAVHRRHPATPNLFQDDVLSNGLPDEVGHGVLLKAVMGDE